MDFIECLEIFSSFRDDNLLLPKTEFCKIEFYREEMDYCLLSLVNQKDQTIFNENFQYQQIVHKVNLLTSIFTDFSKFKLFSGKNFFEFGLTKNLLFSNEPKKFNQLIA